MKQKRNKHVKALARIFASRDYDAYQIATAMRGPDNGNAALKAATTEVIRYALLGPNGYYGFDIGPDNPDRAAYRRSRRNRENHFLNHARKAFHALDLSWDEVNEP